jgi:hypothetical protein
MQSEFFFQHCSTLEVLPGCIEVDGKVKIGQSDAFSKDSLEIIPR